MMWPLFFAGFAVIIASGLLTQGNPRVLMVAYFIGGFLIGLGVVRQ